MRPAWEGVRGLNRKLSSVTRGPTFSISIHLRKGSQEEQTENERKTAEDQTLPAEEPQAGNYKPRKHPNYRKKEKVAAGGISQQGRSTDCEDSGYKG